MKRKQKSKSTIDKIRESAERVKGICRQSHDLVTSVLTTLVGANEELLAMSNEAVIFRTTECIAAACPSCEAKIVVFTMGGSQCAPVAVMCVECDHQFALDDAEAAEAAGDHESDPALN